MSNFQSILKEIASFSGDLFHKDFLLTWEKSVDELRKIVAVADALQWLRRANISTRCFDSGLAVSIFRDQSTRTRFSFSPPPTCWGSASRTWTKAAPRSLTARPCARRPT